MEMKRAELFLYIIKINFRKLRAVCFEILLPSLPTLTADWLRCVMKLSCESKKYTLQGYKSHGGSEQRATSIVGVGVMSLFCVASSPNVAKELSREAPGRQAGGEEVKRRRRRRPRPHPSRPGTTRAFVYE